MLIIPFGKARTKLDAYEYLYPYLNQTYNYLSNDNKNKYIQNYILKNILPHISNNKLKVLYLGLMISKLIKVYIGINTNDDRDSYVNKRIETPGILMANITYLCISKMVKEMKQNIPREINKELLKFSNTVACCADNNSDLLILIVPCCIGANVSASGNITDGPEYFFIFERQPMSSFRQ